MRQRIVFDVDDRVAKKIFKKLKRFRLTFRVYEVVNDEEFNKIVQGWLKTHPHADADDAEELLLTHYALEEDI